MVREGAAYKPTVMDAEEGFEKYNLSYSSATIRNDMMELENMGMLEKTHTSSGRVPSAKGYRYYIDNLREDFIKLFDEAKKPVE